MKDDAVFLLHIRDCLRQIEDYTGGGKEVFFADRKTQDAVVRNLEIIGEAVKNLSNEVKEAHPQVPWKRIAGMRDVLIHHYFGVKMETVWDVLEKEIPSFASVINELIGP